MYRILVNLLRTAHRSHGAPRKKIITSRLRFPLSIGVAAACSEHASKVSFDADTLDHEFLIRQATTVNVNAATQLLTVTLVAIQETNRRLCEHLTQEICLLRQAMEWGEAVTPPEHWDQLVAIRGVLVDHRHNLATLTSYMEHAEKIGTVAAEVSFLSGNIAASDAMCERIEQACRMCSAEREKTAALQQESLELQQRVIGSADAAHKGVEPSEPKKEGLG